MENRHALFHVFVSVVDLCLCVTDYSDQFGVFVCGMGVCFCVMNRNALFSVFCV